MRRVEAVGHVSLDVFALLFCAAWATALVAFPLIKGMPIGWIPVGVGLAAGAALVWRGWLASGAAALARLPPRAFLMGVLALATVLRLGAIFYFPLEPKMDDQQFHRYAIGLLNGEGYGVEGYRAFFPPGMPFVLTALYWITGPSVLAGKLLHLVISCVLVWQVWATARLVLTDGQARLAGLLVAVLPTFVFYTATLGYETLLALILLVVCRLAATQPQHWDRRVALSSGIIGVLLGVGTLIKPVCLLMPAILGAAWWLTGRRLLDSVVRVTICGVVMVLVVSPWTWRNYQVFKAFVPVSTNGGVTLYSVNNARATGLAEPVVPPKGEHDELSRDRLRSQAAVTWMRQHPGDFLVLAGRKAAYTWGATSSIMSVVSTDRLSVRAESVCKAVLNATWAALFVLVLAATLRRRAWSAGLIVFFTPMVAYVFVLHLFFEANSRHHLTVLPILVLIAVQAEAVASRGPRRTFVDPPG